MTLLGYVPAVPAMGWGWGAEGVRSLEPGNSRPQKQKRGAGVAHAFNPSSPGG